MRRWELDSLRVPVRDRVCGGCWWNGRLRPGGGSIKSLPMRQRRNDLPGYEQGAPLLFWILDGYRLPAGLCLSRFLRGSDLLDGSGQPELSCVSTMKGSSVPEINQAFRGETAAEPGAPEALEIIAYQIRSPAGLDLVPAWQARDWIDTSNRRFARRCQRRHERWLNQRHRRIR